MFLKTVKSQYLYPTHKRVIGEDFISPHQILEAKVPDISYRRADLERLYNLAPWDRDIRVYREHVVLPAPPRELSLLCVVDLYPDFFPKEKLWWKESDFAHEESTEGLLWFYFSKEKPFKERRLEGVTEEDDSLNAAQFAWMVATYRKVRGLPFPMEGYYRTSTKGSDGNWVLLNADLEIYDWSKLLRECFEAVAARKK